MRFDFQTRRALLNRLMVGLCGMAAFVVFIPLGDLLWYVLAQGVQGMGPLGIVVSLVVAAILVAIPVVVFRYGKRYHWAGYLATALAAWWSLDHLHQLWVIASKIDWKDISFFIHRPTPVGVPGGGMANAIVGTITLILIASLVGLPVGIFAGVYLAEFGKKGRFAWLVRFTSDVLSGVPSIVTGIVAYTVIVRTMGGFSALAGGVALGFMMIPIVTRTTEELVKLVPHSLREASWALGIPQWRTILQIIIRTAKNGILTGVLLSIARVSG
ncbi:MAG TPA: phosphate ABC transporter permease PstA, partial [bacterium]|nr:phosphate ABC transporter permease PstA [bacterium]